MSTFALDVNSNPGDIVGALNYVLSNLGTTSANANVYAAFGNVLVANSVTGQITTVSSTGTPTSTVSYLYNYVNIKYANNSIGTSGFSSNCTNKLWYGVHNTSDGSISTNPAAYTWKQVAGGGFGTTKGLYYSPLGGGQVYFAPGVTAPEVVYQPVLDDVAINLQTLANSIVQNNNIEPLAITGNLVAANTIEGGSIVTGSITTNLLAANLVIAKDILSVNATFGDYNSVGYWMAAANGNARFGGTMSIGNNLAVGDNAVIGNSLGIGNNAVVGNNLTVGNNAIIGSSVAIGNNLTVGNNAVIGGNLQVIGLITSGALQSNTVSTGTMVPASVTTTGSFENSVGGTVSYPTMNYSGFSSPYYQYQSASTVPYYANVTITTSDVVNIISGAIDVYGWSYSNNNFIPQLYGILIRKEDGYPAVAVAGTTTTTPAYNLIAGGTVTQSTGTLQPYRLTNVGITDTFTAATVPNTVSYYWVIGGLVQVASNTSPGVLQPNVTFTTASLTATNYKR